MKEIEQKITNILINLIDKWEGLQETYFSGCPQEEVIAEATSELMALMEGREIDNKKLEELLEITHDEGSCSHMFMECDCDRFVCTKAIIQSYNKGLLFKESKDEER